MFKFAICPFHLSSIIGCLNVSKKLLFTLLFIVLACPALHAKVIDRVVAVVNEELITLSELEEEGEHFFNKVRSEAPADQLAEALLQAQKQVLGVMIDRKLLLQRAKKRGVTITPEEIDMQYFGIMEKNGLTEEQFRVELAKMGSSPKQYKDSLKAQIVRQRLISYEIRSKVVITNEAIEKYYSTEYGLENEGDGLHILQIGVLWGDKGRATDKEDALRKAEQLRGMIMAGEQFDAIAREYSDLPSAQDGGDIGIFAEDELSDTMRQGLADLKPGEMSMVLETPAGFQFFKLLSAKKGNVVSQAPLEMVREEIRSILHDRQMKEKFDKWVVKLREHSYVEEQL